MLPIALQRYLFYGLFYLAKHPLAKKGKASVLLTKASQIKQTR